MKTTDKTQVGDVISSPEFENLLRARDIHFNGVYNEEGLKDHKKLRYFNVNPTSKYRKGLEDNGKSGTFKGKVLDISFKVKPGKLFVVIEAKYGGGGTGMGRHDIFPDAWQVTAKALNDDGTWNPKGIVIRFHQQTNCFNHTVEKVNVHKKMQMIFI